ncbi:hypothetical protein LINPERHAP2_LOCUS25172 [Linum perenne]
MTVQRRSWRKAPRVENQNSKPEKSKTQVAVPLQGKQLGLIPSKEGIQVEIPSSQPKMVNVYVEALRKVLEDSSTPQPTTAGTQQKTPSQGSRPTLSEITNTSAVQAPEVASSQGGNQAEITLSADNVISGLVNVPVIYQNPTFQSTVSQPKTQKAAAKLPRLGLANKLRKME